MPCGCETVSPAFILPCIQLSNICQYYLIIQNKMNHVYANFNGKTNIQILPWDFATSSSSRR